MGAEENRLARAKTQLVLRIPLVIRLSPIVVEPTLAIVIPIHVENVRVAIRVA